MTITTVVGRDSYMERNNSTSQGAGPMVKTSNGLTTQKKMLVPRVVWASLATSNLFFLALISQLPGGTGTPIEPMKLGSAVLILVGLFLGHGPAMRPPFEKAFPVFIASLALCESFSLFGFVMHQIWSEPTAPWFAVGGFVATVSLFPRTQKFIAPKRSSKVASPIL